MWIWKAWDWISGCYYGFLDFIAHLLQQCMAGSFAGIFTAAAVTVLVAGVFNSLVPPKKGPREFTPFEDLLKVLTAAIATGAMIAISYCAVYAWGYFGPAAGLMQMVLKFGLFCAAVNSILELLNKARKTPSEKDPEAARTTAATESAPA